MSDLGARASRPPAGAWRWLGIGCGIVVLALVVVFVGSVFSAKRLLAWGLARTGQAVMAALPEDTTPIQRRQLREKLDCVAKTAAERRLDETSLGKFGQAAAAALADHRVTTEERQRLLALLDDLCQAALAHPPER